MKADTAILCALHEHLAHLLSVSTPLLRHDCGTLVEHHGQVWVLALQGRTSSVSFETAQRLLDTFVPDVVYTFGPGALIAANRRTQRWFMTARCARLILSAGHLQITDEIRCAENSATFENCDYAELLVSADDFVADNQLIRSLAEHRGRSVSLLDMGGYGVSRACAEARVPCRHFRWATDGAGDTAVAQFSRNVRDLAKRGDEILSLLQETNHEPCVIN